TSSCSAPSGRRRNPSPGARSPCRCASCHSPCWCRSIRRKCRRSALRLSVSSAGGQRWQRGLHTRRKRRQSRWRCKGKAARRRGKASCVSPVGWKTKMLRSVVVGVILRGLKSGPDNGANDEGDEREIGEPHPPGRIQVGEAEECGD